jgi:hypothetical protein
MYICTGVADTWYMEGTVICPLWLTVAVRSWRFFISETMKIFQMLHSYPYQLTTFQIDRKKINIQSLKFKKTTPSKHTNSPQVTCLEVQTLGQHPGLVNPPNEACLCKCSVWFTPCWIRPCAYIKPPTTTELPDYLSNIFYHWINIIYFSSTSSLSRVLSSVVVSVPGVPQHPSLIFDCFFFQF